MTNGYLYVIIVTVFCAMTAVATNSNAESSPRRITPISRHLKSTTGLFDAAGFLIDNLAIRNADKPNALNKKSVSNRPKRGIFLTAAFSRAAHNPNPATYNLKPITCRSNRNSQELKTNVTL